MTFRNRYVLEDVPQIHRRKPVFIYPRSAMEPYKLVCCPRHKLVGRFQIYSLRHSATGMCWNTSVWSTDVSLYSYNQGSLRNRTN